MPHFIYDQNYSSPTVDDAAEKVLNSILKSLYKTIAALLFPLFIFSIWQISSIYNWVPQSILPPPLVVWQTLSQLYSSGDLAYHFSFSASRIAWGFTFGTLAGLALGSLMGLSRTAELYLFPTFKVLNLIPPLGWIPLLILLVGIDDTMKILIISKAVLTPVTLNTMQGIRSIHTNYFEVADVFGFSRTQRITKLLFPATVPSLFTGVRYGFSNAWMALVAVELLASSEGIGYLLAEGRQLFELEVVMAMVVVIGVTGWSIDRLLAHVENRLLSWHKQAFSGK